MADLRAEAMQLIQQMPDRELALIMSTLREKAKPVDEEEAQRKRDEGWKTFQKYIGRLPAAHYRERNEPGHQCRSGWFS